MDSQDTAIPHMAHTTATAPLEQTDSSQKVRFNSKPTRSRKFKSGRDAPRHAAHDWYSGIHIDGVNFMDDYGRKLLLRGVNLGGSSKLPTRPNSSSHISEKFFEHRDVSFVGRPFPLEEAHEHLGRLRAWGLTFVRLLVPWESLEAKGPGIYDEEYIDYLIEILRLLPQYGLRCLIDPHQDLWSRFSGGSGAPGWTFEVANLDIQKFKNTGAAYVHNVNYTPGEENLFLWPTNYTKLASATMFTVFFAGQTFTPKLKYRGESAQEFLQRHYIDCYCHLAARLVKEDLEAVVGFEVMNEPHQGYIGLRSLNRFDDRKTLVLGDSPSALQSFALADGTPQEVEVWVKSWPFPTRKASTRWVNTEKEVAWLPNPSYATNDQSDSLCLWKAHGVWDYDPSTKKPTVLKADYFCVDPVTKAPVVFEQDFYLPFVNRFARSIRGVMKDAFIFVEPLPNEAPPIWSSDDQHEGVVYAPHWYDLKSVFAKSFDGRVTHDVQALSQGGNVISATYFGLKGARRNYEGQVANIKRKGVINVGQKPCLVGECGIPFDMNGGVGPLTGDYTHHSNFLDAVISAMESNLVHFSLWNYNTNNDDTHGDHWNGEDFSIYSSPRLERKKIGAPLGPSPLSVVETKTIAKSSGLGSADVHPIIDDGKENIPIEKKSATSRNKLGVTISTNDSTTSIDSKISESAAPLSPFDVNLAHFSDADADYNHYEGGRVLDALQRTYAAKIAGDPISMKFNVATLDFHLEFCNPSNGAAETRPRVASRRSTSRHRVHGNFSRRSRSQRGLSRSMSPRKATASSNGLDGDMTPLLEKTNFVSGDSNQGSIASNLSSEANLSSADSKFSLATDFGDITEIFIPNYHYSHETLDVQVSDGEYYYDRELQTLFHRKTMLEPGFRHVIHIGVLEKTDGFGSSCEEMDSTQYLPSPTFFEQRRSADLGSTSDRKIRRDHLVRSPAHAGPLMGSTSKLRRRPGHASKNHLADKFHADRKLRKNKRVAAKARMKRCCNSIMSCNIL